MDWTLSKTFDASSALTANICDEQDDEQVQLQLGNKSVWPHVWATFTLKPDKLEFTSGNSTRLIHDDDCEPNRCYCLLSENTVIAPCETTCLPVKLMNMTGIAIMNKTRLEVVPDNFARQSVSRQPMLMMYEGLKNRGLVFTNGTDRYISILPNTLLADVVYEPGEPAYMVANLNKLHLYLNKDRDGIPLSTGKN